MRWMLGLGALAMAGCVVVDNDAPAASGGDIAASCDAGAAQGLVGQPASSGLAAEARRLSGAETVRWLQPGQIVTMEYRVGRLNIKLDARNRVEAITCG